MPFSMIIERVTKGALLVTVDADLLGDYESGLPSLEEFLNAMVEGRYEYAR
jgi:hypothetical protein